MDCILGAQTYIEDESTSLVIADPPYNLGFSGTNQTKTKKPRFKSIINDNLSFRDYRRFTFSWLREAYRILKPGHHFYFFIDWRMYPHFSLWVQKVGFVIKNNIVWDKVQFGMGYHYRYQHEFIVYGIKPSRRPVRRPKSRNVSDIWRIKRIPSNLTIHPTEKPVELYDRILTESSFPKDLVVDFFMGSGPSFLSEHAKPREMRGFEIDPENIKLMKNRFSNHEHIEFIMPNLK